MEFAAAFQSLNIRAVITATVVSYFFMALWYSPFVFGERWTKESHLTGRLLRKRNTYAVYVITILMNLAAAFILGMFITEHPTFTGGLIAGFGAGFFWVSMFISIIYTFERRPLALYFIDCGYSTLAFTIMGGILGGWNQIF
jgi:MFS family permease